MRHRVVEGRVSLLSEHTWMSTYNQISELKYGVMSAGSVL